MFNGWTIGGGDDHTRANLVSLLRLSLRLRSPGGSHCIDLKVRWGDKTLDSNAFDLTIDGALDAII